jgi:hypothetical protein
MLLLLFGPLFPFLNDLIGTQVLNIQGVDVSIKMLNSRENKIGVLF